MLRFVYNDFYHFLENILFFDWVFNFCLLVFNFDLVFLHRWIITYLRNLEFGFDYFITILFLFWLKIFFLQIKLFGYLKWQFCGRDRLFGWLFVIYNCIVVKHCCLSHISADVASCFNSVEHILVCFRAFLNMEDNRWLELCYELWILCDLDAFL